MSAQRKISSLLTATRHRSYYGISYRHDIFVSRSPFQIRNENIRAQKVACMAFWIHEITVQIRGRCCCTVPAIPWKLLTGNSGFHPCLDYDVTTTKLIRLELALLAFTNRNHYDEQWARNVCKDCVLYQHSGYTMLSSRIQAFHSGLVSESSSEKRAFSCNNFHILSYASPITSAFPWMEPIDLLLIPLLFREERCLQGL